MRRQFIIRYVNTKGETIQRQVASPEVPIRQIINMRMALGAAKTLVAGS